MKNPIKHRTDAVAKLYVLIQKHFVRDLATFLRKTKIYKLMFMGIVVLFSWSRQILVPN